MGAVPGALVAGPGRFDEGQAEEPLPTRSGKGKAHGAAGGVPEQVEPVQAGGVGRIAKAAHLGRG